MEELSGRKYLVEFGSAMVAYTLVLFASIYLLGQGADESIWRIPLAAAPMIPMALALWAFLRQLNRMDEMQRRIQLNAIALAAGAVGMLTFAWGFLELVGFPSLPTIWVFPLMIFLWGAAGLITSRRYQ